MAEEDQEFTGNDHAFATTADIRRLDERIDGIEKKRASTTSSKPASKPKAKATKGGNK